VAESSYFRNLVSASNKRDVFKKDKFPAGSCLHSADVSFFVSNVCT
jgi:hypothetical protein